MEDNFKSSAPLYDRRHIGNQGNYLVNILKKTESKPSSEKILTIYGHTEEECKTKASFILSLLNGTIPDAHPF